MQGEVDTLKEGSRNGNSSSDVGGDLVQTNERLREALRRLQSVSSTEMQNLRDQLEALETEKTKLKNQVDCTQIQAEEFTATKSELAAALTTISDLSQVC